MIYFLIMITFTTDISLCLDDTDICAIAAICSAYDTFRSGH